jgi:hypothetical protein
MSSGKKLAPLNLGILRFSVPAQVLSVLGRYAFLLLPQAEHISFVSGVHHGVYHHLGELAEELLEVD